MALLVTFRSGTDGAEACLNGKEKGKRRKAKVQGSGLRVQGKKRIITVMRVTRFEDLEIWKLARELYKLVFKITSVGPFYRDFKFRDQIRESSGSVSDNIAEGFERGGNKEFIQFLSIAKGSCGETRNKSYRAFDSNYISQEVLDDLLSRTETIARKTANLIKTLKNSDLKGIKYD
jgi:four helix bundle protein